MSLPLELALGGLWSLGAFLTSLPLLDWRPCSFTRMVVLAREAAPLWAVLASLTALVSLYPLRESSVVMPTQPQRAWKAILLNLFASCLAPILVGLTMGLIPAAVRCFLSNGTSAADWLALLAVYGSVTCLLAAAFFGAVLSTGFVRIILTLGLTLLVAVFPVAMNNVLANTGRSTVALGAMWGMPMPDGVFAFVPQIEALRLSFFLLAAICLFLAATTHMERGDHRFRGYLLLLLPVAVWGLATAISPELVKWSGEELLCHDGDTDGSEICLSPTNESLLPEIEQTIKQVTALAPTWSGARYSEPAPNAAADIWLPATPPAQKERYLRDIAFKSVQLMTGQKYCSIPPQNRESRGDHSTDLAAKVQSALLIRAGFSAAESIVNEDGSAASVTTPFDSLSDDEFRQWWIAHSEQIQNCQLTPADLPS